jgi:hypothetical protein
MKPVTRLAHALLCLAALTIGRAAAAPPVNLTQVGHIDLNPGCGLSDALFVHDDRAYVMEWRVLGSACDSEEGWMRIIDVSDPSAPFDISQTRLRGPYLGDMHGIYYSNGYVYCARQALPACRSST